MEYGLNIRNTNNGVLSREEVNQCNFKRIKRRPINLLNERKF